MPPGVLFSKSRRAAFCVLQRGGLAEPTKKQAGFRHSGGKCKIKDDDFQSGFTKRLHWRKTIAQSFTSILRGHGRGGAALSTYTKKGNKWVFGGEYLLKNNPYKDGKIPVAQFTAEGGYYFKILSDARKIVFVYAGASALAGYESVNWGEKVLHDGSTLHDRDAFIYGGALTLDVEFYVADRIALLANLRERWRALKKSPE